MTSGSKFNYFFAVSLSFAAMNVSILLLTFRLKRDEISSDEAEEGHQLVESTSDRQLNGQDTEARVENGTATETAETSGDNSISSRAKTATLREVLVNKTVLTISFFLMCYCVCRSPCISEIIPLY